ncbi:hypothetical protein C0Q70_09085 [Pomacea canaliculata]|uniref:Uncharacterized protein n=1 Tax=Pomacea canaliculata TaxID=400727 RepID=A0A2T7P8T5_POMCA|nr:hypothetical protein C0Q70_09085 [Pomacea canaliculata]
MSRRLSDSDTDGEEEVPIAHRAAAIGDVTRLAQVVQQDPSMLEMQNIAGLTPLAQAVHCQQMAAVKRLVKMGADINAQDGLGRTCLCIASYQGWHEGVVYLLRNGARQNICDKAGRYPVHTATYNRDVRQSLTMMLAQTFVKLVSPQLMSPVHWAAFHNRPEHLHLLMERGGDVMATDTDGKMALHWAAQNGSKECCRLLTSFKDSACSLFAADNSGKTPVHYAAAAGHADLLRLLAQCPGCDAEAEDPDGRTPLHWAAAMGHAQCVEVLLEVGVRVNVKDVDGGTPMAYARQSGNTECGRLLEHALRLTGDWHENKQRRRESDKNSISRLPWNPLTFIKCLFASRSKDGNINHSHLASSSLPHAPPLTQTVITGLGEGGGEGNGCSQSQDDSRGRWRWPSEESSSQPCYDTFSM